MANGNYFTRKLSSYVSRAPQTYVNSISAFSGGLNTSKSAHLIEKNETPYMKNLMFENGGLYPRMSQFLGKYAQNEIVSCYEKPYYSYLGNPHLIYCSGGALYSLKLEHISSTGKAGNSDVILSGDDLKGEITATPKEIEIEGSYDIPEVRGGVFFEFGGSLFYKARGCYIKIKQNEPENKYKLEKILDEVLDVNIMSNSQTKMKDVNLSRVAAKRESVCCDSEYIAKAFCTRAAYESGYIFDYYEHGSGENAGKFHIIGQEKFKAVESATSTYYHLNVTDYVNAFENFAQFLLNYLSGLKDSDGNSKYNAGQISAISEECEKFKNEIKDIYYPAKVGSEYPGWFEGLTTIPKTEYKIYPEMSEEEKNVLNQKNAYIRKLSGIRMGTANKLENMSGYFDGLLDRLSKVASNESLDVSEFKAVSLSNANKNDDIYIPTVATGLSVNGTGAILLQAENRLTPLMKFKYCGDGQTAKYYFPVGQAIDTSYGVWVDVGDGNGDKSITSEIKVDIGGVPSLGVTKYYYEFKSAPAKGTNNITFTFALKREVRKTESEDFYAKIYESDSERKKSYESFMECDIATVYGGGYEDVTVVFGGSESQKNAYFWSGIGEVADASYIPFDYYNLTSTADAITGFGVQQAFLAIFSERSVGKSNLSVVEVGGLSLISLGYSAISTTIGCNVKHSIQLVENCLIFANTYGGVYRLSQTSDYNENSVERISEKVNADCEDSVGLLSSLRSADTCCSIDDGKRYMLFLSRHAGNESDFARTFIWDYSLYYYGGGLLSWFYWEGVDISSTVRYKDKIYACGKARERVEEVNSEGNEISEVRKDAVIILDGDKKIYSDFGDFAIDYVYVIPPSVMGSYSNEKEVSKACFTVDRDVPTRTEITYISDFERRRDLTDIIVKKNEKTPFSMVFIRRPRAVRVHNLSVRLECNECGSGFSMLTSQIFFKYMQEERTYLER